MVFTQMCWHPPLLNLHSSTSRRQSFDGFTSQFNKFFYTLETVCVVFTKNFENKQIWKLITISRYFLKKKKKLHVEKKEIKQYLTQTVVSIVRQMKSIVTCAAIVARYIVAFMDTTTIKLQITLINVWETTEKNQPNIFQRVRFTWCMLLKGCAELIVITKYKPER